MDKNDLAAALRLQGWRVGTDTVSDMYALRDISDRIVQILPGLRSLPTAPKLSGMASLGTPAFSKACATIRGGTSDFAPLVRRAEGFARSPVEEFVAAVDSVTGELSDWAVAQDLEDALARSAQLPITVQATPVPDGGVQVFGLGDTGATMVMVNQADTDVTGITLMADE